MTFEEVINYVFQERDAYIEVCEEWEALDMAIKALEKQLPKKPTEARFTESFGFYTHLGLACPACGKEVYKFNSYCAECGQKLDRSENNGNIY